MGTTKDTETHRKSMKKIYAFDFDGTLTTKDTLLEFIRFAKGTMAFAWGFAHYAHLLVLMKLGLYPNYKAKQKVFAYFFKDMSLKDFNALCKAFAASSKHLLRPAGIAAIQQAQNEGSEVLIVSASIDNWVQPFFDDVKVLGTQIEVMDGKLTGRFLTSNCYGQEKVNRILALYSNRQDYHLIAFGDSKGDKELLAFADESHFKPFR
jgi:HAD superfamily hydrolase (TIGR01490 family)